MSKDKNQINPPGPVQPDLLPPAPEPRPQTDKEKTAASQWDPRRVTGG